MFLKYSGIFFYRDGAEMKLEEIPAYRSAKHGEVVDNSLIGMHVGESVRWLAVRSSPIKDDHGVVSGAVVILNDLIKLITAENVIRENEQRLRLSHSIGKIGISEFNLKTGGYFWSDEFCDIFEIPHKEEPVELSEFEKFIVPEDIEWVMSGYAKDLETKSDVQVDYRIRTGVQTSLKFNITKRIQLGGGLRLGAYNQ